MCIRNYIPAARKMQHVDLGDVWVYTEAVIDDLDFIQRLKEYTGCCGIETEYAYLPLEDFREGEFSGTRRLNPYRPSDEDERNLLNL